VLGEPAGAAAVWMPRPKGHKPPGRRHAHTSATAISLCSLRITASSPDAGVAADPG
jgi:hypothetical protein